MPRKHHVSLLKPVFLQWNTEVGKKSYKQGVKRGKVHDKSFTVSSLSNCRGVGGGGDKQESYSKMIPRF